MDREDEDEPFITVIPDWVCEIGSPGTRRIARMKKLPIFAREKIPYVWLVEPIERMVEVFRHEGAAYSLVGTYGGDDAVRAEPFDAVEIPPAFLWGTQTSIGCVEKPLNPKPLRKAIQTSSRRRGAPRNS